MSGPPEAALSSVIAAMSTCGVCPQATSFSPPGGLDTHTQKHTASSFDKILKGFVKEISSPFIGWSGWVRILYLKHNSGITEIFPLRLHFNCIACFALAAAAAASKPP